MSQQGHKGAARVVAVVGSPRAQGNTSSLVDVVLEELSRRGAHCQKFMLGSYLIRPCLGHEDCATLPMCPQSDDADELFDTVYGADALILATPVYFEDVSAQMKLFIDRTCHRYYHDQLLTARVFGLIAIAAETGVQATIDTLKRFVALSSSGNVKQVEFTGLADRPGDALADDVLVERAREMADEIAAMLNADPAV
ncbi:MAG: flavodoxin family protein [Thermoleophilia bacterium]